MMSYEVHGLRVSSSAVREALAAGDMARAAALLGRPYSISGHVLHGRKLGPRAGLSHAEPALRATPARPRSGIFVVRVHGLADAPLPGVASLGVRPTVEDAGRVLLEVHCLRLARDAGPRRRLRPLPRVELLHKLHDELQVRRRWRRCRPAIARHETLRRFAHA